MSKLSSASDIPLTQATYNPETRNVRRFLFYSHDGLGVGHVRRNLAIARALAEIASDASILILTAADDVASLGLPPRVISVKLPGPHRSDQKVLAAAVEIFRPEVLLVDHHPFGPGGELGPALELVRAAGGRAVLGLPDVLDDPQGVDREWRGRGLFERIPEVYERALVYGQPDLIDTVTDSGFPSDLAQITSYCGYVVSPPGCESQAPRPAHRRPRVLATVGGGDDGVPILETFVAAAAGAGWDATIVTGAHCPQDRRAVLRASTAEAGVAYRNYVPGLPAEFADLDALVCMGGYNTLAEAAACGIPTVSIPRLEPTHDQLIRARAFQSLGLVRLLGSDDLSAEALRDEIEAALSEGPRPPGHGLDLAGDRRAAHHLVEVAAQRPAPGAVDEIPLDISEQLAVAAL